MSIPRRRRRDHEPLNPDVGTLPSVPMATGEIPNAVASLQATPSHEEIARRAHQIYEQRGGEHGRDVEDWLRAERELQQRIVREVLASGDSYAAA